MSESAEIADVHPLPMVLRCPECGVQHVEQGAWATTRIHRTHLCVACGNQFRPCEWPTVGIGCTGISASWCPIHGDCECPDPEQAKDDAGCPLHRPGSEHDDGGESKIRELESLLSLAVLRAVVHQPMDEYREWRVMNNDGTWSLVNWHIAVPYAVESGVITADEAAFLHRASASRGGAP